MFRFSLIQYETCVSDINTLWYRIRVPCLYVLHKPMGNKSGLKSFVDPHHCVGENNWTIDKIVLIF